IPALWGTRLYAQFDTYLKSSRIIEYTPPTGFTNIPLPVRQSRLNYLNAGARLGIELFRGFKLDYRLRGARVSYGKTEPSNGDPTSIPVDQNGDPQKPGIEGNDVSNEIALTIDRRANFDGVETGYQYHASLEYSLPQLGSDFHYYVVNVTLRKGAQVFD